MQNPTTPPQPSEWEEEDQEGEELRGEQDAALTPGESVWH